MESLFHALCKKHIKCIALVVGTQFCYKYESNYNTNYTVLFFCPR